MHIFCYLARTRTRTRVPRVRISDAGTTFSSRAEFRREIRPFSDSAAPKSPELCKLHAWVAWAPAGSAKFRRFVKFYGSAAPSGLYYPNSCFRTAKSARVRKCAVSYTMAANLNEF